MVDRIEARKLILNEARAMAHAHPERDFCTARERYGLLGKIKHITGNVMPTAKQCWESVGISRSAIVDEFEFTQDELKSSQYQGVR